MEFKIGPSDEWTQEILVHAVSGMVWVTSEFGAVRMTLDQFKALVLLGLGELLNDEQVEQVREMLK